ncbi:MAG: hypothetical protein CMB80_05920, partial [Flammeovirgaceae bacterium]|nr:hypothetical protein [Flammeovirgaceae bacterium]
VIAYNTREAGHLTTRQHAHFTFAIEGVSRGTIWSFLHAHPFYNTSQQSQRYVQIKNGASDFYHPKLMLADRVEYDRLIQSAIDTYEALVESLYPLMVEKYYHLFPARTKQHKKYETSIRRLCMEEARYVMPLATPANLYYTISALSLMRLAQLPSHSDFPIEAMEVVTKMVEEVEKVDPEWVDEDVNISDEIKDNIYKDDVDTKAFDEILSPYTSKLVEWTSAHGTEVFIPGYSGLTTARLNELLTNPLNLYSSSREMNLLSAWQFTFFKKLSLTAHAQQQRHRSLRDYYPFLYQVADTPEWITPKNIEACEESNEIYQAHMEQYFTDIQKFDEQTVYHYLLPNAYPIRVQETGDLLGYFHLWKQRLCLLAQNEIWECSMDEVDQVKAIYKNSPITQMLGAPCHLREKAGTKPYCPEGARFCGQKVWDVSLEDLARPF